jgi:penicillin-binding protein 1C
VPHAPHAPETADPSVRRAASPAPRRARIAIIAAALSIAAALVAPALQLAPAGAELPSFAMVRAQHRSSEAWLLDRDGAPLHRLRLDYDGRRLDWVALADISGALRQAVLLSEDRRFERHSGVDWIATGAAAWQWVRGGAPRGASTITMQLVALLDPALARQAGGRSLRVKWAQMRAARTLELRWQKDEILEAYLNLVPFRHEAVGVGALAQSYFGRAPSGLDRRQSALAAALVRAPSAPAAAVARRACALLRVPQPSPDCTRLRAYARAALARARPVHASTSAAPHLARRLLKSPGTHVSTTLDGRLQRFAARTLQTHLRELAGRNVEDGAVLVVDNATGEVLAWVGGSGALSAAPEVDAVTALRQAGSTLKPFLYAQAIEGRWLTAASILDDAPLDVATASGLYVPQNYDRSFRGRVSVRTALGASLNVPAVRTLLMVGPEAFHHQLRAFGFDSLRESGGYYGYSLALGSADVSLAMLANAYRALANGGRLTPLRTSPGDPPAEPRQVVDAAAAYIVADILGDRNARVATFGLGSPLDTTRWSAVKTGTSKDMRDNWCIGFDARHTVAVWVGNVSGAPMWDVSGVSGAAPVWQAIMAELQRRAPVPGTARGAGPETATAAAALMRFREAGSGQAGAPSAGSGGVASSPSGAPAGPAVPGVPPAIVRARITFDDSIEPPREELFLPGTQMARVLATAASGPGPASIVYPGAGTVIALDPDIPPRHQGVPLSARGGQRPLAWTLDGRTIGSADSTRIWSPSPGRHRLSLVDGSGREVDAVIFEVRGASVPAAAPI